MEACDLGIRLLVAQCTFIYLGFNVAFNTLYGSYHDELLEGQRKPVHTVGQGSVLYTADQRQATTSFPTLGQAGNRNSDLRGGRREYYHWPPWLLHNGQKYYRIVVFQYILEMVNLSQKCDMCVYVF